MIAIAIAPEVTAKLPNLILGGFVAHVGVETSGYELSKLTQEQVVELQRSLTPESIRNMPTVKANKDAYRLLGKDPNRYRPASESLLRRIASGKGLYAINNVVDILNLISIKSGYSICGYDYETIQGNITLGVGSAGEPYEGLGRGELNIESLPVFRDALGAFGTPTSDSVRTQVGLQTKLFLMIIIGFDQEANINLMLDEAIDLLSRYAKGEMMERFMIGANNNL